MGAIRRGAGAVGRGCYGLWGRGQRRTCGRGGRGRRRPPERAPRASAADSRASLFSPNSRAVAVEPALGAGTRQAASPRGTQPGGVENLQELGGGFDPRPQLIPLQTWSCLLPRPPQGGGGGGSLPLPRPRRSPAAGAGAGARACERAHEGVA